jgi:hypothetical protein
MAQQQGCQMVYFLTKNPNLGTFWRALEWKMLVCLITIRNVSLPFCMIYGHLVILWSFVIFSPVLVYFTKKNLATLPSRVLPFHFFPFRLVTSLSRSPLNWAKLFFKNFSGSKKTELLKKLRCGYYKGTT